VGSEVRLSTDDSSAGHLGDEGALFAHSGFLVATCRNRRLAALALEQTGATIIVMDDGLQQGLLIPSRRVAVVDDRFPEAHGLIPAGYRRTWSVSPSNIDLSVHLNGARVGTYGVYRWGPWRKGTEEVETPPKRPAIAFSAIARPEDFLLELGDRIEDFRCFPDHHRITPVEWQSLLAWAGGRSMICTAKDWIRLDRQQQSVVFWRDRFVDVRNLDEQFLTSLEAGSESLGRGAA
jgi:tetraacyldisaccharide-1-P 4'-kinase